VLRAIAGLVRPPAGSIALGDDVWLDSDRPALPQARRASASGSSSRVRAVPAPQVRQNVAYSGKDRVDEYLNASA